MKKIDKFFREFNPAASKYWIDEMNKSMTPDNMGYGSGKRVFLRCPNNPKHIFEKQICGIPTVTPFGCPYCSKGSNKKIAPGENDFFTECKEAKDMWDYEKNVNVDPTKERLTARVKYWFKCEKGHSFQKLIRDFKRVPRCPVCRADNFQTIASFPHMMEQWDFEKNTDIDVNTTLAHDKRLVWWKCKKCGYNWEAQIFTRKVSKGLCPCCEHRNKVVEGVTDLFTLVPDIKKYYDYDKNRDIDISKLSVATLKPIWWRCPDCNYNWSASPTSRIIHIRSDYKFKDCPSCNGQVRTRTFYDDHPELFEMFHSELNECNYKELKSSSCLKQKYWWSCSTCGESFESTLESMIRSLNSSTKGCSYCSGKKVIRANSFAILHPELMDEYDPDNEIDPYSVTEYSGKKAKWICRNNNEHKWEATFSTRACGHSSCPTCHIFRYDKMLYEDNPNLEMYYDTEKNIRPFNSYSVMSNQYVWWKCLKGHSFQWSIMNFSKLGTFECPICNNKKLARGINDLQSRYPYLAKEFDEEKNRMTAADILCNSSDDNIWWKCEYGHEFQRSIWYRLNYTLECPVCARYIVAKGVNDFQTTYPMVINVWDFEKNDKTPDEITDNNNDSYWFLCEKGHHYSTKLKTAVANSFHCMICSKKILQKGVNTLLDTTPLLAKEWALSNERGPETVADNTRMPVNWICPTCNGEYSAHINDRQVGDDACPYCTNKKVLAGYNTFDITQPELVKEWSLNNERPASDFFDTSAYTALWNCPTCHGEYSARIRDREVGDDACPYCTNRKTLAGYNTLEITQPALATEWSRNNERPITDFFDTSAYMALWNCPTCNGEYPARIRDREVGDDACPYCTNRKTLAGYNTLEITQPALATEWSRNNERPITDFFDTSAYMALWNCPTCNGEYPARIRDREVGDDACPYCNGRKVLPGFNSFNKNHPDLMEYWDYINNYLLCNPNEIGDNYNEKVWWFCKNNKEHKYQASPKQRIYFKKRKMEPCTYCKGRRRKKRHFI